jgi:hypothetical protein
MAKIQWLVDCKFNVIDMVFEDGSFQEHVEDRRAGDIDEVEFDFIPNYCPNISFKDYVATDVDSKKYEIYER